MDDLVWCLMIGKVIFEEWESVPDIFILLILFPWEIQVYSHGMRDCSDDGDIPRLDLKFQLDRRFLCIYFKSNIYLILIYPKEYLNWIIFQSIILDFIISLLFLDLDLEISINWYNMEGYYSFLWIVIYPHISDLLMIIQRYL
jgi:hypothetical protein